VPHSSSSSPFLQRCACCSCYSLLTVRSLCLVSAAVRISTQINLPPSFRAMRTITEKVTAACPTYDHVIVDIQGGRKVGNSDDEIWFCIYIHSPQALKCTLWGCELVCVIIDVEVIGYQGDWTQSPFFPPGWLQCSESLAAVQGGFALTKSDAPLVGWATTQTLGSNILVSWLNVVVLGTACGSLG